MKIIEHYDSFNPYLAEAVDRFITDCPPVAAVIFQQISGVIADNYDHKKKISRYRLNKLNKAQESQELKSFLYYVSEILLVHNMNVGSAVALWYLLTRSPNFQELLPFLHTEVED